METSLNPMGSNVDQLNQAATPFIATELTTILSITACSLSGLSDEADSLMAGSVFNLLYYAHRLRQRKRGKICELTFLIADQSVIVSRSEIGVGVPCTTVFIRDSMSFSSGEETRTTNIDVVVSDTPYRLRASVIYACVKELDIIQAYIIKTYIVRWIQCP